MEPLKPETKQSILANRPDAVPEDIQEYERLLAQRFTVEPSRVPVGVGLTAPAAAPDQAGPLREARLRELYKKLFG